HSIRQTNTETSTEFMQHFLRLAGFLGVAAGTEEEQAKNFQWGLRRSTLNHLMCMSYTDVAQCGQAGHLQKDCKKNITASTSGQADKKPGASGRVFAITEGHAS
nr:zinc finger, CCHC-type, retrotransposon Gag domain protein [Tanacetum cinerariifolium]